MSEEGKIREQLLKEIAELKKRLDELTKKSKPTLTVRLGDTMSARRQRYYLDDELDEEFLDDWEEFDPFIGPIGPRGNRLSERYLGGLNALISDTLEWLSESTDMAARVLRPPVFGPRSRRPWRGRIRRYL